VREKEKERERERVKVKVNFMKLNNTRLMDYCIIYLDAENAISSRVKSVKPHGYIKAHAYLLYNKANMLFIHERNNHMSTKTRKRINMYIIIDSVVFYSHKMTTIPVHVVNMTQ
jgi:hypothetical protein